MTRLRGGDEMAFAGLVDDLNGRLLAVARTFTTSPALAEDIVQETWLAVIRGLAAFEGRSSLRTWVYSILIRRARTMAAREARRRDATAPGERPPEGPAVEWEPGLGRVGLWEESPRPWRLDDPAALLQGRETLELVGVALAGLPESQRRVVLLRDVEEMTTPEVCNILELSETNMRVLLHRGRARIRRALDRYMRDGARPEAPTRSDGRSSPTRRRPAMTNGAGIAGEARAEGRTGGTGGGTG